MAPAAGSSDASGTAAELALWWSADSVHMVIIATFGVSEAGIPAIAEMSLMPVTPQWLPIEDSFE